MGLTSFIIDQQVPMKLFAFISHYVSSKLLFLVVLNLFILVMNMVEIFSAIIIVVPIIVPVALRFGVDPAKPSGSFGKIAGIINTGATGTGAPRRIEFMMRLEF